MNGTDNKKPKGVLHGVRAFAAVAALGLALLTGAPSEAQAPPAAPPAAEAAAAAATPPAAEAATPAPVEVAPAEVAEITAPEATVDKADTGWMMVSSILVLLMIIPGLALFYGGLVRTKNMLSVLMQVSTVTVIGMIMYALVGYSLSFTTGPGALDTFIGGASRFFLNDVVDGVVTDLSDNNVATFSTGIYIPELVFVVFQMTFACITAALVLGGLAERVKFIGVVLFAILWPLMVYYPMAHMVWWWPGPDAVATHPKDAIASGLIWGFGALDFAGGTVVHINSGIAALVGCIILGKRTGYKKEPMPPHSLTMTLIGTGLLWFGWFGFNAGSNLESNYYSVLAMANTFLAPAAAGFSWTLTEWVTKGKPSLLGLASGIVAGLVAVTPAAGFAGPMGAILLGLVVSPVCLFACSALKSMLGYDDALDVFGIHGVGGIIGALGTGLVVNPAWGGAGVVDYIGCSDAGAVLATCPVAAYDLVTQVTAQAKGVLVTIAWSGVGSLVIFLVLRVLGLLRASKDAEQEGLDISTHGEAAYHP
ncbi:MAG: ammonium transporter [Hyphomonadaceae bacterium]|nr:ammonium transporter [Hyphomonadaceae bacterium]